MVANDNKENSKTYNKTIVRDRRNVEINTIVKEVVEACQDEQCTD